jgi:hypothetical protein
MRMKTPSSNDLENDAAEAAGAALRRGAPASLTIKPLDRP